jgi:hypothetical protein
VLALVLLLAVNCGAWDVIEALKAHRHQKKRAAFSTTDRQLFQTAAVTRENAAPLPPDKEYHGADKGWDSAQKKCAADGRRLCKATEYCTSGQPIRGSIEGDIWAPSNDEVGNYVSLGRKYPERLCKTHKELFKGIPGWAQSGFPGAIGLCCGNADPAIKAEFTKSLGKIEHHLPTGPVKHDPKEVLEAMLYWKRKKLSKGQLGALFPQRPDKYISFEIDAGGFNNIRIAYEYVILAAVITGRTLVLPPATGWYLIDWGNMGEKEDLKTHHHSFVQTGHYSDVGDFFDVEDMCSLLNCVTTAEFLKKERARFSIPARHTAKTVRGSVNGDPKPWNDWIRTTSHSVWASWHPLNHVLYWPSKAACAGGGGVGGDRASPESNPTFSGGRSPGELTAPRVEPA